MFLFLYGANDGQALLYGFLNGMKTVIILIPIYAVIAFLRRDKQKNSGSKKSRSLKYEDAVRQAGGTVSSSSVFTAIKESENDSAPSTQAETVKTEHTPSQDASRVVSSPSRFPIMTILLCVVFLAAGLASGYFFRDVKAKEEIQYKYEVGINKGYLQRVAEDQERSEESYNNGYDDGFVSGFRKGTQYAIDELSAGRTTGFSGLSFWRAIHDSLEENRP